MASSTTLPVRAALAPIAGAIGVTVLCVISAVIFLRWRGAEQHRALQISTTKCRGGDKEGCDTLRDACLKRSAEACVNLAEVYLSPGSNRDPQEGARLLGEACLHRNADACFRAGTMYAAGTDIPKNPAEAKDSFQRGCYLGNDKACTAQESLAP